MINEDQNQTGSSNASSGNNVVEIKVREVYGRPMIYPVNFEAVEFAKLTGKKTFSVSDLRTIRGLGFGIRQVEMLHPEMAGNFAISV